jgi:hypothetical protein
MKMADDTDRMFREAVFFQALKKGNTPEQAAQLAREVLLDYGMMPDQLKQGLGQYFLYQSFQYAMGVETLKAFTKPRNARFVIAELNRQRQLSRDIFGGPTEVEVDGEKITVYGDQFELSDAVLYFQMDKVYEKDADAYYTYYRSPMIGSFKQITGVLDYVNGIPYSPYFDPVKEAAGKQQKVEKAGLDGVLDAAYSPILDLMQLIVYDPEMEYKKPLPDKVVYQLAEIGQNDWITGPEIMTAFDMEIVELEDRRVGRAEIGGPQRYLVDPATGLAKPFDMTGTGENPNLIPIEDLKSGGYQIRFKSAAGLNKFMLYQAALNFTGVNRLANDVTGTLIAAGYLPEGTSFGYSEKGNPIL